MPVDIWKTNMIQRRTILVLCLMTLLILRGGEKSNAATYDNIGDFFQGGNIFDESASVAGGYQE